MFRKHLREGPITVQVLPDGIELEDRYGEITRLAEQSIEQLTEPTIDISDILVGKEREVFIDGGHTNEEGARLVAVETAAAALASKNGVAPAASS